MFNSLHTVAFNDMVTFVAFDAAAARDFANRQDNEYRCAVSDVEELPLVDNYGFYCDRRDAAVLFPWLAHVTDEAASAMLTVPFYMTESEREAADLADDIAYWQARLS